MLLQVVALSSKGLRSRGNGEESFLAPLEDIASSGISAAEAMKQKYSTEWNNSVDPLYSSDYSY